MCSVGETSWSRCARSAGDRPPQSHPCPRDCSSGSPDPERMHGEENPFRARSAGACPPRLLDPRENRTPTNAVFPIEAWRGTGPRPTVNGTLFLTVARGPVPRDRPRAPRDRLIPNGSRSGAILPTEAPNPRTPRLPQFNRPSCRHRFKGGIDDAHLIDATLWRDTVRFPCG